MPARFDLMFAGILAFAILGFAGDRILMNVRARVLRGQTLGTEEEGRAMSARILRLIARLVFDSPASGRVADGGVERARRIAACCPVS